MQAAEHTRRGSQEPSQKTLVLAFTAGGVLAAATIILLVFAGATPFQCFAIPIVFATFVISLWMAARWRQWRALPVCGVAALVLARLTIDLAAHCGVIPPGHLVQWIREVLAWTAVPAAFAAIAYLWRIFENQARFVEAQKALQENARQYRHLVQNATDAVYTANVDGTFTLVNAGVAKLFGRRAADLNAMSFFDLVSGDVRTVMEEALQRQTSQDVRAFYHEFCVTRRDGPPVWVGQNLQAVIEHGRLVGFQAVLRDISRQKQAEEALHEREARLRTLVESMTEGIIQSDTNGRIAFANPAARRLLGLSETELAARSCLDARWEFLRPDGEEMFVRDWPGSVALKENRHVENACMGVRRGDGNVVWLHVNAVPVPDTGDGNGGVVVTFTDISAAKAAEDNVRIVEFALDNADEHVLLVHRTGRVVYANKKALDGLGYTLEEILQRSIHDIDAKISPDDWSETWRRAKAGEWPAYESEHIAKNGNRFPTVTSASYFEFGGQGYIFAFVRDISHETELAAQLRQSQKMEAIGTLAGGIAHDFNNILSAVLGYTEIALGEVPPEGSVHSCLTEVHSAARRAADLVAQILTFSRRKEEEKHPLRIPPVVKEAVKLLRGSLPATIELRARVDADCPAVMADPGQIHQVVMNLCTNAYQAMPGEKGVLEIELRETELSADEAASFLHVKSGAYVMLSVRDNGCGMDEKTRRRMFEPFFTTKEGEGTGLGLATVHGIVKSHKGAIRVDSKPGQGTRIDVVFPVCAERRRSADPVPDRGSLPHGAENILLVDDEKQIRASLERGLGGLGYRVTAFPDAAAALAAVQATSNTWDLLITDQTMPGMTGAQLVAAVRRCRPDLPVILCTGYSTGLTPKTAQNLGAARLVAKPFGVNDMAHVIRDVLDGQR